MFRGRRFFKGICLTVTLVILSCRIEVLSAQGMSRSHGLGTRLSLWKTARSSALINVTRDRVELSGAGAWLYFFSRFRDDWFFEFSLGVVASVVANEVRNEAGEFVVDAEDITAIIPFLFGFRYDFLSFRNQGALQPYLSLGAGPYWITSVDPQVNNERVESGLNPGAYLGGGLNIGVFSWFAFNFDLKYHLIDFQFGKDFSGVEFGMGASFMWGQKRELIRIQEVKMIVSDIYPAYYQFYNFYPLAIVSIKNLTKSPIEVNIRSNVKLFSERPKDTGYIRIAGKETKDIPITAIFGPRVRRVANRESTVLDLRIEARAGRKITREFSNPIMVHSPNSWNGEMDKLVFFVTSDDEKILSLSRRLVGEMRSDHGDGTKSVSIAREIFDQLGFMGLRYHSDPNIPFYRDDRVQYANETLDLRGGDCDDLVVLYASLLQSVGIKTAFVEVQDPSKELAHLYLMFATGITADQGHLISSNDKRYVMRDNWRGQKTIWLPVETTLIGRGFDEAWKVAAVQYLQEGVIRKGVAEGWVRVFDVE